MENQIYRIFVFDSNEGNLLYEEDYMKFSEIQKEIIDWNQSNQNNRKNIYVGTEFPPKGLKFNKEIKQFVSKLLSEQVADGEVLIPLGSKLVGETIVRLTNKEMFEQGLLTLEYNEKVDEFDHIVKMNIVEMFLEDKATKYQVFEHFFSILTLKIDKALKKFHNYPIHEINSWEMKKNQSVGWLQLTNEEKNDLISGKKIGAILYQMLITEAISTKDPDLSIDDKIAFIDMQAQKITTRFKELEIAYANLFSQRDVRKERLKKIIQSDISGKDMILAMEEIINEQL